MIRAEEARKRLRLQKEHCVPPTDYTKSLLHQAVLSAIERGLDQVDFHIINVSSLEVARSETWLRSLGYLVQRSGEILVISFKE